MADVAFLFHGTLGATIWPARDRIANMTQIFVALIREPITDM